MHERLVVSLELRTVECREQVDLEEGVGGRGHERDELRRGYVFSGWEGRVEGCGVEGECAGAVDWVACVESVVSF